MGGRGGVTIGVASAFRISRELSIWSSKTVFSRALAWDNPADAFTTVITPNAITERAVANRPM